MLAPRLLTSDVRFEGWTTEDWIRFVGLWQPRATPEREPTRPRGGVIVVHEDGQVLKVLHTRRGRLDPSPAPRPRPRPTRARSRCAPGSRRPWASWRARTVRAGRSRCASGRSTK